MSITNLINTRLAEFRDYTEMWGSNEAVELQALQLLEFEVWSLSESLLRAKPRLILELYAQELQLRFNSLDIHPLHEIYGAGDPAFGATLFEVCNIVRARARDAVHSSQQVETGTSETDELHSNVLIDGAWDLDDLADFPRRYSQVYYFLYLARQNFTSHDPEHLHRIFANYNWNGGYVYATFYREIAKLVPPIHRPEIESIKYSSPGHIRLRLSSSTATALGRAVEHSLAKGQALHKGYKWALEENRLCHRELKSRGVLHSSRIRDLYRVTAQFAAQLEFINFEILLHNTGDVLIASNIVLAYYRRLLELADFTAQEKARFQ